MHGTRAAFLFVLAGALLAGAASAADKPPEPVIETTYIAAPKLTGQYQLIKSVNFADEGKLLAGVSFRYRDGMLSPMTTDIFIYPTGGSESLEQAEQDFRSSVAMAAQQGVYSNVVWGESVAYNLTRRDGGHWIGRMITMHFRANAGESVSRTYLFHHGLYDYKLRIDVPVLLAYQLPAAADALVRTVLPQIQVVSVGSCGKQQQVNVLDNNVPIPDGYVDGVSPDGYSMVLHQADLAQPAAAGSSTQALLASPLVQRTLLAKQRQIASGCTHPPYEPDQQHASVLKLHFPENFWRADAARRKH